MYCTMGGIEAVIWTDTVQTVILFVRRVDSLGFIDIGN